MDVDFPDLIRRKTAMIKQAPEITNLIGEPQVIPDNLKHAVQLQTKSYIALGCDLTKLDDLSHLLNTMFDLENTLLTFTAEVSITYMPKMKQITSLNGHQSSHMLVLCCLNRYFLQVLTIHLPKPC